MMEITKLQLDIWKKTPLAVNTQPDISKTGNREVIDMAVRAGCWLRSDSVIVDEPEQIEALSNRPPWLAVLDLGGNYWSLWTEADNIRRFYERYPKALETMQRRIGYRVRPSWVWQRKRYDTTELVVAFAISATHDD